MWSMKRAGSIWYKILIAGILLLFVIVFACCLGSVKIPVKDVAKAVIGSSDISKARLTIIRQVRIPRILMSALIGGSLAVVGTIMQGLFKNPMADPSVLGISSGSAFGAALVIVMGLNVSWWGFSGCFVGAMAGALLAWLLVYNIARISGEHDLNSTLLAGIAISSILSALITILMTMHRESMEQVYLWMLGSFSNSTPQHTLVMAVASLISVTVLFILAPRVDVLKLGKEAALGLGVSTSATTGVLLCICSFLLAFCVANSGIIGFIGLIIPHCVGFLKVYRMRGKILMCFIVGAIFTVICDTVARTAIAPGEIAIGAMTARICMS